MCHNPAHNQGGSPRPSPSRTQTPHQRDTAPRQPAQNRELPLGPAHNPEPPKPASNQLAHILRTAPRQPAGLWEQEPATSHYIARPCLYPCARTRCYRFDRPRRYCVFSYALLLLALCVKIQCNQVSCKALKMFFSYLRT